jgi:hypothetical protein
MIATYRQVRSKDQGKRKTNSKSKAKLKLSRTRHAGDKGERKYCCYLLLTSALDGDKWSASRPGCALPPGKDPRYPLYRRLVGPQTQRLEENSFASAGEWTPVFQSLVRHCTHWATQIQKYRWKDWLVCVIIIIIIIKILP